MGDFLYEREVAPCGIAIEEIYGAEEKSAKVWKLFAMQIFSEAEGDYRTIEHLENGAPLLDGIPQRISLSHTSHFMVIASIPKTPDINLEEVSVRTAIGVDAEKADRAQIIKIREKFLTGKEMALLPAEGVRENILAWTCKEALYKAAMGEASDWKEDYQIVSLPIIAESLSEATSEKYGIGIIRIAGEEMEMHLSSWEFEEHIVTLAFSGKIARHAV